MAELMVDARSVRKRYGSNEVLAGVSLSVEKGEVLCIIGPSGSGKSTFLRCLNHLESINGGRIYVNGELMGYRQVGNVLHEMKPKDIAKARQAIGMVFQRFNLFPHLTALQNIIEAPIGVAGMNAEEAKALGLELLEQVGLADKGDHYPAQLSGGQQQRVAIARALAMKPKLMLFDEPTSALDKDTGAQIMQMIRDLSRSPQRCVVVVTHDFRIFRFADRIAEMEDGRISRVIDDPSTLEIQPHL